MLHKSLLCVMVGALALQGCAVSRSDPRTASDSAAAYDRLAFTQAACGGCHAVEPPGLSPNPAAPTFEAIANREGLSDETLTVWLTDAHNYPEVMDFDLDAAQVEMIADYMITLRRADYVPSPG